MDMALLGSSIGTVVVGLVATLLALALLVQVLQEMWKHLGSTRATVYTRVLKDFLGDWAVRMTEPGVLPDLQARGPFQFRRVKATGKLLPLGKDDLVAGLERTAAPWHRRALRALRTETEVQNGQQVRASAEWLRFMRELVDTEPCGPGDEERTELIGFFGELGASAVGEPPEPFNAPQALRIFRERFMPHVLDAEKHFGRLEELFDYQYRRRNMVLTFAFGVAVAFLLNFPVQAIYRHAAAMSPDQTAALANSVQAMYQRTAAAESPSNAARPAAGAQPATTPPAQATRDSTAQRRLQQTLDSLLVLLERQPGRAGADSTGTLLVGLNEFGKLKGKAAWWYVVGCLVTGVLISFGAPFWNDLLGALSWKNKPAPRPAAAPAETDRG